MDAFSGEFVLPRLERVIAGPGTAARLAGECDRHGLTRVVVVTGRTLAASPRLEQLAASLGPRLHGVFAGVRQHVPAPTVAALVSLVRESRADGLISIGGGSPIDTAKAAAHALLAAGGPAPVHIAMPTTLSAGEFTDVAGVSDETTRIKHAVSDVRIAPRTVIADPELTLDTPAWLWAASGIRALDHAVESLYSRRRHPITEAVAVRAIATLTARLPPSLEAAPSDRLAHRGECQMAAWLAVFGVTNAGFGLSHTLGHQVGPRWNVPHGMTSAVLLPHAMQFMAERAPGRFALIAAALGIPFDAAAPVAAARTCGERVAAMIRRLGLPARLRYVGVPADELPQIAAHVAAVMHREAPLDAPVTEAELVALLARAY